MQRFQKFLLRFFIVLILLSFAGGFLFAVLPPPGTIPVMMYHFVGDDQKTSMEGGGNVVTAESFAKQMAFLKKLHYRVISIDDYYAIMTGAKKPRGREVLITFDDGDSSFATNAVPILEKYQFPVTMFLVSDLIKTGKDGSMVLTTVKELQKKYPWIDFESHSKSHPHLLEIDASQVKEEMAVSKRELSEMLGKPVRYFAYPYGQFNAPISQAAQDAGYLLSFTTSYKKLNGQEEGLLSMTRIKISKTSDFAIVLWYHLSGLHQLIKSTREKIRNHTNAH